MRTLSPVAPDRIEGCETETITALRLRYRELCNRIVKTREGDSDERWRVFCEVSEVREQLLPLIKNDRAYLAFEPDTSRLENQLLTRALELSGGIRAHFEQKGKATQEDVLLQELFAVQDHLKSSYFANFLLRIELLRARDTAAALWRALEEQLKLDLDTSSRVLSVGAGLAQFEILVHNNTGARVQTIDLRHDIPDLAKSGAIEHLRGCFLNGVEDALHPANLVILKDVLHHTENPEEALRRAARKLEPGGKILVVEPSCAEADQRSLSALRHLDSTDNKDSLLSQERWEELFEKLGLRLCFRRDFESGVIDNNDSFPRTVWILKKYS